MDFAEEKIRYRRALALKAIYDFSSTMGRSEQWQLNQLKLSGHCLTYRETPSGQVYLFVSHNEKSYVITNVQGTQQRMRDYSGKDPVDLPIYCAQDVNLNYGSKRVVIAKQLQPIHSTGV